MSRSSTYSQLNVYSIWPAPLIQDAASWVSDGVFHARKPIPESSSWPYVDRWLETATGLPPLVVQPCTGPWTV